MVSGWWKELSCMIMTIGLLVAAPLEIVHGASTAQWAILIYVEGTGDLKGLGESYQQYLEDAAFSEQVVVAVEMVECARERNNAVQVKRSLYGGTRRYLRQIVERPGASRQARLANLIKWGMDQVIAEHYALVVAGHGQIAPILTDQEGTAGAVIPDEARTALSAEDLSAALKQGLAASGVRKLGVVFLDCCFGATFEVASELRPVADYLVGSPGLMYSPGLPWDEILSWLAGSLHASERALARHTVESLENRWEDEPELPVSVIAVDLSAIDAIGERLDSLATAMIAHMPAIIPEITLARSQAESWGPYGELVDLGGLMVAMSSSSDRGVVAQRAHQVARAVERAVVASYLQGSLGPTRLRHLGLAVFFPLGLDWWPDIYHCCGTGKDWGSWELVLRRYLDALDSPMVEQLNSGVADHSYTGG